MNTHRSVKIVFRRSCVCCGIISWLTVAITFICIVMPELSFASDNCAGITAPSHKDVASYATCDFIAYWSASKLLLEAKNPYDPTAILNLEQGQGLNVNRPMMMWNPPWVPVLFFPFTQLDYQSALRIWFLLNLFLFILLVFNFFRSQIAIRNFPIILGSAIFLPVFDSLSWSQMGIILAWGVTLVLDGLSKKNSIQFFLGLLLLSIKFHVFLLFFAAAVAFSFRELKMKSLIVGYLVLLGIMITPEFFRFGVMIEWFEIVQASGTGLLGTSAWMTASISTFLKDYFFWDSPFLAPSFLGKILLVISLSCFLLLTLKKVHFSRTLLGDFLILSNLASPYLWLFDFSSLFPLHLLIIRNFLQIKTVQLKLLVCLSILFQIMAVAISYEFLKYQNQYFGVPIGFAFIWLLYRLRIKPREGY